MRKNRKKQSLCGLLFLSLLDKINERMQIVDLQIPVVKETENFMFMMSTSEIV